MSEYEPGHGPENEPGENEYQLLGRSEDAEVKELSAEVRSASQHLYDLAHRYTERPGTKADQVFDTFMQELSFIDLPKDKLVQALEDAAERAEGNISTGLANAMDPFLDDTLLEHEAESVRLGHEEGALNSSEATILLLLAVRELEFGGRKGPQK